MFTADMIAPCGLDCSICKRALAETRPCAGAAVRMTTNRSSVQRDAASSCVKRERQTGIRSVMSVRISLALTSWKRKPGTGRSTRSANPRWRICVSSGKPGWLLFWNANGDSGPVPTVETSSVSIQVFAAAAADSIMVQ